MNLQDVARIRKNMEKELDAKRYEHTLGVAYTAACLAMCHNEDPIRAEIAGLLHDSAKCFDNEKRIRICKKNKIGITESESKNPFLLHAKVGAFLAEDKYGIKDSEIKDAILFHTTGRPKMGLLEKIIYIADYIEPCRKQSPKLPEIRKIAFTDLDQALLMILSEILHYLSTTNEQIDPMTQLTYDYYIKEQKKTI